MKIIKRSGVPEGWKHTVECVVCGSLLEAEADDVRVAVIPADYQMEQDFYDCSVICAVCGESVSINAAVDQDTAKAIYQQNRWKYAVHGTDW